ncbi:MAG: hypothetical protein MR957_00225 [Lachnobacterium sp.]|nr:hypothetical protein [Lachnobacterium sp.]
MKKLNLILKDASASPEHLVISIIFSLYVMEFVNLFIGSMGGIPAFMGSLAVYYILALAVKTESEAQKGKAADKTQIKNFLINYVLFYVIVWIAMEVILFISRFSGWGNVKKLNVKQYFKGIYGASVSDSWIYIFAAFLVFAFIVSLFPLIFVRTRKYWIEYIMTDSVIHALICVMIVAVGRIFISGSGRKKAMCVFDELLLCKNMEIWQIVLFLAAAVILTVAEVYAAYRTALKICMMHQKEVKKKSVRISTVTVVLLFGLCVAGAGTVVFFMSPADDEEAEYTRVARCLTDDSKMGPMVYRSQVYVPIKIELDYDENGKALGYIGYKGQDCESRFYKMAVANVLYSDKKDDQTYMQMSGADRLSYKKMSVMEKVDSWKRDNVFLLWDEDWSSESAYSKEVTGYTECEKQFVESLENTFGEVKIDPQDFKKYDAYFTIESYPAMKDAVEGDNQIGTWVGCILVKDNKFYYGNYENQITGVQLQKLLDVLGGN